MKEIFIYWIDKYRGEYRSGVSHGSKDGGKTLCNRTMKPGFWDGGYTTLEIHHIECKNCIKALNKLTTSKT